VSSQQPDVTDEEIGLRSFRIRREKAVERALERLRQGLGPQWAALALEEVRALDWVFGELWSHVARSEWDEIPFSALHFSDVTQILDITSAVLAHDRVAGPALEEIHAIVSRPQPTLGEM
jgi:hypothetical protein